MNYDLIQTIIGGIGLIAVFLLWRQIRNESKWKKLSFSVDKIDISLLTKNANIIKDHGIDMNQPEMSNDEFSKIMDGSNENTLLREALWEILNMFERFATLYNMNVLNKYFSYESYGADTIFYFKKFRPIIDHYCDKFDPLYYKNFKKCANEFIENNRKESKKIEKYNQKIKKMKDGIINKANATKDKF